MLKQKLNRVNKNQLRPIKTSYECATECSDRALNSHGNKLHLNCIRTALNVCFVRQMDLNSKVHYV
jgi:hypothetical protein